MRYIKTNFVYNPNQNIDHHIHEIQGSVAPISPEDPHKHLFATISGEAIIVNQDHIHEVKFSTDQVDGHSHEFTGKTTGAIPVGNKHVHFIHSETTLSENHKHKFSLVTYFATSINNETKN